MSHQAKESKMGKNVVTRWQHSDSESLSLFFKREAPNFSCLRTQASKGQCWDQSIRVCISRDGLLSMTYGKWGSSGSERFSPPKHRVTTRYTWICVQACLFLWCVYFLLHLLGETAFTLLFLAVPISNEYMESFGKLWEDTCFLVLNSTFLGCPKFTWPHHDSYL